VGASDEPENEIQPSEQRGGVAPGEQEMREKGEWAAHATEGVVPPDLGGSDAPTEMLSDDPELGSSVLGGPAASEEPATETGIDPRAGDRADATTQGGPEPPEGTEPDLRDAPSGPRQADVESAG
jgi:hypothetical protein